MRPLAVLNKRERAILYVTVGLFVFALGFNFVISPFMARSGRLNREIEYTKTKLKKYLILLGKKNSIMDRYSKYSETYKLSAGGEEALVQVLSDLENLAKNASVRIQDIRPDTSSGQGVYKEIAIDLRTEADMNAYLKFMYDLENSLSLFKIKRYKLSVKQGQGAIEGSFSISKLMLN